MAQIKINRELCKACEYCIKFCPKKIIKLGQEINAKGYQFAKIEDMNQCIGCGTCALMCPEAAIEIEE